MGTRSVGNVADLGSGPVARALPVLTSPLGKMCIFTDRSGERGAQGMSCAKALSFGSKEQV